MKSVVSIDNDYDLGYSMWQDMLVGEGTDYLESN